MTSSDGESGSTTASTGTVEGRRGTPPGAPRGVARTVSVSMFLTLDGYMVGPDEDISWVADGFDAEMANDIAASMGTHSELFAFGRLTYEMFASYWPTAVPYQPGEELKPSHGKEDPRIIQSLNESPKVVFSTTMETAAWNNTRVVRGAPDDEIRKLKQTPGKDINIQGSASIVQALQRADLIDEYRLFVHPVLLGNGKPLFAAGISRQDLAVIRMKPYANGVVMVTYRRKERPV